MARTNPRSNRSAAGLRDVQPHTQREQIAWDLEHMCSKSLSSHFLWHEANLMAADLVVQKLGELNRRRVPKYTSETIMDKALRAGVEERDRLLLDY